MCHKTKLQYKLKEKGVLCSLQFTRHVDINNKVFHLVFEFFFCITEFFLTQIKAQLHIYFLKKQVELRNIELKQKLGKNI